MSYYTTLENIQSELRLSTAFDNNTSPSSQDIDRWIQEESKIIELRTGQIFGSTAETSTLYDYDGSGIFRFPHTPIISISNFEYNVYGPNLTSSWIPLTEGDTHDYLLYTDEGEAEFINGANSTYKIRPLGGKKKFRITYTYGYKVTPLDIQKLATMMVAKRVILSLINSQSNTEGGDIQVGTIRVSDPSNYSINYIKSLNEEIESAFKNVGQGLNTFRGTRVYG